MSGYAAGDRIDAAVDVVKGLTPGDRVDDISSALTGSDSAIASGELRTAWNDRFKKWHQDAATFGETLRTAAENYDEADWQAYLEYKRRTRGLI